jgi:chemotaxis protein methyltransferase CheR
MRPATSSLTPLVSDEVELRLQDLIHVRTGLKFGNHQREGLIREIKRAGESTPEQYYSLLSTQPTNAACWDDLIKALTISETYFFRDSDQMQMLRKYIIPDLLARHWDDHTLRVWSAGCATGEEAYTLAMLLCQQIPDIEHWKITILATDINKHALEKAQRGKYRDWSFREQIAEDPLVETYFTRDHSGYQIRSSIKDLVHFAILNLSEDSFPSDLNMTDHISLILCRNVTMYLPVAVIQQLAHRFYECLLPGGWLMLAASENNDQIYYQFKSLMYEKALVYQKVMSYSAPSSFQPLLQPVQSQLKGTIPVNPTSILAVPDFHTAAPNQPDPVISPGQPPPSARPGSHRSHPAAPPPPRGESAADSSQKLFQAGTVFIKEHKFEEARKCLLEYLDQHPQDLDAQCQLTIIEANSGHFEEAQKLARQIIDQNPLICKAYALLAMVYQNKGELDLAVLQWKKVLYLDPDDLIANYHLAALYQKQGFSKESFRYRQQAIKCASKLQPDDIIPDSDNLSVSDFLKMVRK